MTGAGFAQAEPAFVVHATFFSACSHFAHAARTRARLMAKEPLRFSAAVSQITLDDDVELLANVFLQQARRIPHLLRHVAEGRCTLGPLAN